MYQDSMLNFDGELSGIIYDKKHKMLKVEKRCFEEKLKEYIISKKDQFQLKDQFIDLMIKRIIQIYNHYIDKKLEKIRKAMEIYE